MNVELLDDEIIKNFPGAIYIACVESTVLRLGQNVIHVYPTRFPRSAIERLAAGQNYLTRVLQETQAEVIIDGIPHPIRANAIREINQLPDQRVYTVGDFNSDMNLDNAMYLRNRAPGWLSEYVDKHNYTSSTLIREIDTAIVSAIGIEGMPEGYQLNIQNVHIGEREITIVDYAADVYSLVH